MNSLYTQLNILFLQHASSENPGALFAWADYCKHTYSVVNHLDGDPLPAHDTYDLLVPLGGPISLTQKADHPPILREIDFIAEAIQLGKPILGICLGQQLISEAYGYPTTKNAYPEFGTFPIALTEAGKADPLFKIFPQSFKAFHSHSDLAGLPYEATILASSSLCPRQAIRYAPNVYGIQFHLEYTAADAPALTESIHQHFAQQSAPLPNYSSADYPQFNQRLVALFDQFTALLSPPISE